VNQYGCFVAVGYATVVNKTISFTDKQTTFLHAGAGTSKTPFHHKPVLTQILFIASVLSASPVQRNCFEKQVQESTMESKESTSQIKHLATRVEQL
jgi:hypothetical protein